VQEESMTLISEELHDNITQSLGTIKRYIAGAEHAMPESREKEHLRKAKQIITNVIKEVRHISHSLNSELIENAGLHEVLQKNLEYISESSQIECHMDIKGTAVPLAREQNLLVYRIFQEAMHNITKHAGADKANILFEYTASELMITIEDNGKGFDAEMAQNRESLGLRNIATRAKILHGDLTIRSQLGLGSSLTLNFPINS
jgi:signal transduction histidine kinase